MQDPVERPAAGQIPSERLFHNHARPARSPGMIQSANHHRKQRRWNGQVVQRVLAAGQGLPQAHISSTVMVIALHEGQPRLQARAGRRVNLQVRLLQ